MPIPSCLRTGKLTNSATSLEDPADVRIAHKLESCIQYLSVKACGPSPCLFLVRQTSCLFLLDNCLRDGDYRDIGPKLTLVATVTGTREVPSSAPAYQIIFEALPRPNEQPTTSKPPNSLNAAMSIATPPAT